MGSHPLKPRRELQSVGKESATETRLPGIAERGRAGRAGRAGRSDARLYKTLWISRKPSRGVYLQVQDAINQTDLEINDADAAEATEATPELLVEGDEVRG